MSQNQLLSPKWAGLKAATKYSGLSIRLLQGYIASGLIRSALVKKPGCERGVRLIDLASLDELIEASIGQRVELKMNLNKSKPLLENAPSH